MILSTLIRKGGLADVATATPATVATHEGNTGFTVAKVATVAVADPAETEIVPLTEAATLGEYATLTPAEIVESAAMDGVELTLSPTGVIEADGPKEALDHWLHMINDHEPAILTVLQGGENKTAMTPNQEKAIRSWLDHIGEDRSGVICSVLYECRQDPGTLVYFLSRADEVPR
jgi:hypothetical protein